MSSWMGGVMSGRNTAREYVIDGGNFSIKNYTGSGVYVDWGDDTFEEISTGTISHTYPASGQYTFRLWSQNLDGNGDEYADIRSNATHDDNLVQINNWGLLKQEYINQSNGFQNHENISFSPFIRDYPRVNNGNWQESFRTFYSNPATSWTTEEPPLNWDMSNVTNMRNMFLGCSDFNADVSSWDVSNVTDMEGVFFSTFGGIPAGQFNNGFPSGATGATRDGVWVDNVMPWNVSNCTDLYIAFQNHDAFNSDIGSWDVSNVIDFRAMLRGTSFNRDIGSWDVSSGVYLSDMFRGATSFNCGLARGVTHTRMYDWDTSSNTSMSRMFDGASSFDGDISQWNTSNVTTMQQCFANGADFTCGGATGISWDTSNVTTMLQMFLLQNSFNCDIRTWNVGNVTNFQNFMVAFGTFPIFNNGFSSGTSYTWNWNTSSVTNFREMFRNCTSMNGDIGGWDVSSATNMFRMLVSCTSFDQDISGWNINTSLSTSSSAGMAQMLDNTNLSVENYSRFLVSLANQVYDNGDSPTGIFLGASGLQYSNAVTAYPGYGSEQFTTAPAARAYLTGATAGWTITDAGQA